MDLKNKVLLITGGTGSFGNAVLRRFIKTDIEEIRIVSRDEKKQDDMRKHYRDSKIKFYIGNVRDESSIRDTFNGVDYVFHAAALKQIPSCEFFPLEAVKTNVYGSDNVINQCIHHDVKKAIFLSTDKAAYPISAMGMSKALMEKNVIARSRVVGNGGPLLSITRYGNVMASRGSVIPLFNHQIERGGPVTITDPKMTRFMMSLDDAVDLVVFAFDHGEQGDIFVQKAPACTIDVLAEAIMRFKGKKVAKQIIGTRHGEKLYETLITREEMTWANDMGNYFQIAADNRDLNYEKYFEKGSHDVENAQEYNSDNTEQLDVDGTVALLEKLGELHEKM